MIVTALPQDILRATFGERLHKDVSLAPYTSARIGGPADLLIEARTSEDLADIVAKLWESKNDFVILGGGSNVLVSDKGIREIVVLNRAKEVRFNLGDQPAVWCESGAVLSSVAHRAAAFGLGGLEWAANVPGTVGGAVYGNAGAFGSDVAHDLIRADVLDESNRRWWSAEKMEYGYRSSVLKRDLRKVVILAAEFKLFNSTKVEAQTKIEQFSVKRKATQPPGASMGSMFKNPPGDKAGRLIEAAGLKGTRLGGAEVSSQHANFFVNTANTRAEDMKSLLELVQATVFSKFGVQLEPEIEMIGEW